MKSIIIGPFLICTMASSAWSQQIQWTPVCPSGSGELDVEFKSTFMPIFAKKKVISIIREGENKELLGTRVRTRLLPGDKVSFNIKL